MARVLFAHVDYVTDPEGSPDPIGFVLDTLGQPGSLLLLGLGLMVVLVAVLAWARWRRSARLTERLTERLTAAFQSVPPRMWTDAQPTGVT